MQAYQTPRWTYIRQLSFLMMLGLMLGGWCRPSLSAAQDQSYDALRHWIDNYQPGAQTVTPGQHLTEKDRKGLLEPLIGKA